MTRTQKLRTGIQEDRSQSRSRSGTRSPRSLKTLGLKTHFKHSSDSEENFYLPLSLQKNIW